MRLRVAVGFGDAITPGPTWAAIPTLLDRPAPRLLTYPRETVVAEKLEAMVMLGLTNSRMKDFYDVAALTQGFAFDDAVLTRAIEAMFARQGTPLPTEVALASTSDPATAPPERPPGVWRGCWG